MPTMIAFEFDDQTLLQPVSAESPAGEPLQFSEIYDRIREAQREDDSTIGRGVWTFPLKRADWAEVEKLCVETLKTKAKDLQIAAALLDAWLHRYGFAGLREGLRVLTGLVHLYSEQLLPPDADDLESRLSPIEWINEKLSLRLKLVPITSPSAAGVEPSTYSEFESANTVAGEKSKGIQQSALLTSTEYFIELLQELERCLGALSELEAALLEKLDSNAPSLRRLWSALESIRNLIADFLSQRDVAVDQWMADVGPGSFVSTPLPADDAGAPVYASRSIRSRDEAYQLLAEAADYLARTEPHSPAPYLIRRAITWGTMSLDRLLPELVRNDAERTEIFRLLQIAPQSK